MPSAATAFDLPSTQSTSADKSDYPSFTLSPSSQSYQSSCPSISFACLEESAPIRCSVFASCKLQRSLVNSSSRQVCRRACRSRPFYALWPWGSGWQWVGVGERWQEVGELWAQVSRVLKPRWCTSPDIIHLKATRPNRLKLVAENKTEIKRFSVPIFAA